MKDQEDAVKNKKKGKKTITGDSLKKGLKEGII